MEVDDVVLADLERLAPYVVVEKVQEVRKFLFDFGLALALVDAAGEVHQHQLAPCLEAGFLVVTIVEHDEQQRHRVVGYLDFVGGGDGRGIGLEHLAAQRVDHGIGGARILVDPCLDFPRRALEAEHVAEQGTGAVAALHLEARVGEQGAQLGKVADAEKLEHLAAQGAIFGAVDALAAEVAYPEAGFAGEGGGQVDFLLHRQGAVLLQGCEDAVFADDRHCRSRQR